MAHPGLGQHQLDPVGGGEVAGQRRHDRTDLLEAGHGEERRRPAVGLHADHEEAVLGLGQLAVAVRGDVAAGVVVRVDLPGQGAGRPERGVEVEADLGEEREVRAEARHDDDLVDVAHLLAVGRRDGEATVFLGADGLGAEPGHARHEATLGRRPGVLTESAALLELVVVAATERVTDAGAAQEPRDPGAGVGRPPAGPARRARPGPRRPCRPGPRACRRTGRRPRRRRSRGCRR